MKNNNNRLGLSRRKVLGGLGMIGIASAGAGLGTTAYFSDEENFEGNEMVAGELDLKIGWQQVYYGPNQIAPPDGPIRPRNAQGDSDKTVLGEFINAHPDGTGESDPDGEQDVTVDGETFTWNDGGETGEDDDVTDHISCDTLDHDYDFGDQESLVELTDVKPGDGGQITFNLCLCDNPGYIWLTLDNFDEDGGISTEPEEEVDPDNDPNLAEYLDVYVSTDENCNSRFNSEDTTIWSGTLAEAFEVIDEKGQGLLLREEGCFEGGECTCINVGWEVATDVGNEIQGDSVSFDIGFYTEQCRHNPEPDPFNTTTD